jgi:hypothetical protein
LGMAFTVETESASEGNRAGVSNLWVVTLRVSVPSTLLLGNCEDYSL